MRRHLVHAGLLQGRGGKRGEQHIDRGRRHAHSEDDRDDGSYEQQNKHVFAGKADQPQREAEAEAGDVENADNEACRGEGEEQRGRDPASGSETVEDVGPAELFAAVASPHADCENDGGRADARDLRRVVPIEQGEHEVGERNDEMPAIRHNLAELGQDIGEPLQPELAGHQIDLTVKTPVVEDGGNDRRERHVCVGNFKKFCH